MPGEAERRRGPDAGARASGALPNGWVILPGGPADGDGGERDGGGAGTGEISIRFVLEAVRRRRKLVLLVTGISIAGALAFVTIRPPAYRASVMLRVTDPRRVLTEGVDGALSEREEPRRYDAVLSLVHVLRSRSLAGRVVDSLRLRLRSETSGFTPELLGDVLIPEAAPPATIELRFRRRDVVASNGVQEAAAPYGEPLRIGALRITVPSRPPVRHATLEVMGREEAIDALLGATRVRTHDRTDVIVLDYTASDPRRAQQVVNLIAESFRVLSGSVEQQQAHRRRTFLEEQMARADSALADAQRALVAFRREHGVHDSEDEAAARQTGLYELEMRREELSAELRTYRSLLAALERPDRGAAAIPGLISAPGIAANPVIVQLSTQLATYQAEREALTAGPWGAAETNPDVQRLDGLIRSTRNRLVEAIRSHVQAAQTRLSSLDGLRDRSAEALNRLPPSAAEEARLEQRVKAAAGLVELLRNEHQRARIAEEVPVGQVEIVDPATVPYRPVGMPPAVILALALMLGVVTGSGGSVVLELANRSIRRRDELESVLRVPGLVTIPRITPPGRRHALPLLLPAQGPGDEPELTTLGAPRSAGAEAYRMLRTSLLFAAEREALDSIAVTSAGMGEGKTTTAVNLAVTLAQDGRRVLIVDCDFQRARLHRLFGLPREPGLADVLAGRRHGTETVWPTRQNNLWLMPAGRPDEPADVVQTAALRALLHELAGTYDVVVLDTPPLLPTADAAIFAAIARGVVFVTRAGRTDREAARLAMHRLDDVGARVVGAVLNDPDAESPRFGSDYDPSAYYTRLP